MYASPYVNTLLPCADKTATRNYNPSFLPSIHFSPRTCAPLCYDAWIKPKRTEFWAGILSCERLCSMNVEERDSRTH